MHAKLEVKGQLSEQLWGVCCKQTDTADRFTFPASTQMLVGWQAAAAAAGGRVMTSRAMTSRGPRLL